MINDILEYFHQMEVDKIHIESLYGVGRAIDSFEKHPVLNNWINAIIFALDWARKNKKLIRVGELIYFLNPNISSYCGPIGGKTIVVNHIGKITACSEVVDETNKNWDLFHIGNLTSKFEIDDKKFNFWTKRTVNNMKNCKDCFARYLCRGGCAYKAFMATGNLYVPDPFHCAFIKEILPLLIKRIFKIVSNKLK